MKTLLWKFLNAVLAPLGYELCARKPGPPPATMDGGLARARERGENVGTVIDLGAAQGRWTRKALKHFPSARYLLIEPLDERRSFLEALHTQHTNVDFVIAAAGDHEGTAELSVSPDLDGSGIYGDAASNGVKRAVPLTTLDSEILRRGLPAPFLLKFDTHGFELPILAGATETLKQTAIIVLEAYNFKLSAGSPRFHEICAHMESLGFRCADLVDPMLRARDQLLWQFDLFFLPAGHPAFSSDAYA